MELHSVEAIRLVGKKGGKRDKKVLQFNKTTKPELQLKHSKSLENRSSCAAWSELSGIEWFRFSKIVRPLLNSAILMIVGWYCASQKERERERERKRERERERDRLGGLQFVAETVNCRTNPADTFNYRPFITPDFAIRGNKQKLRIVRLIIE